MTKHIQEAVQGKIKGALKKAIKECLKKYPLISDIKYELNAKIFFHGGKDAPEPGTDDREVGEQGRDDGDAGEVGDNSHV